MATDRKIEIGTNWTDAKGRVWVVYEKMPFGRAKVRSGMRFGEMRYADIREAIRLGQAQRISEALATEVCDVMASLRAEIARLRQENADLRSALTEAQLEAA